MILSDDSDRVINRGDRGPRFGVRHIQSLLLFLCSFVNYWSRGSISMAIVVMTNNENPKFSTFDWNEQQKSYILSSFYWGYIFTQIPFGHLGHRIGSKWILFFAVLIPSILTIATPLLVEYGGWQAFCTIMAIQGLCSGGIYPLFHVHLSKWAPVKERNCLGGFSFSGIQLGIIIAFLLSGIIASTDKLGWPGVFYISGSIGILWSLLWFFYSSNCPNESKTISVSERIYINSTMKSPDENSSKAPTPWKAIFTSIPVWALICVRMCHQFGGTGFFAELPFYFNSIMKLDFKSNAIFSALPYIIMLGLSYLFLFIADLMMRKDRFSLTMIRIIFCTIAESGPALALFVLLFVPSDNIVLSLILITISIGLNSATILGTSLNHIDLSPNYAGVLMGIANTGANLVSLATPLVFGAIVTDETNSTQWKIVFALVAVIYVIGNLIFVLFGKMVTQPWNYPPQPPGCPL